MNIINGIINCMVIIYKLQQHSNLQDKFRICNFQVCTISNVSQYKKIQCTCLPNSRDSLPSFKGLFWRQNNFNFFCFIIRSGIRFIFSDSLPEMTMTLTLLIPRKGSCEKSHRLASLAFSLFSVDLFVKLVWTMLVFFPSKLSIHPYLSGLFARTLFSSHSSFIMWQITLEMWPQSIQANSLNQHTLFHHLLQGKNKTIR